MIIVGLLVTGACAPPPDNPKVDEAHAIETGIDAFLDSTSAAAQVRAILVSHQGKPVIERYEDCTAADYWNVGSMTMTVVGILIGIAIDQGYLTGVDQTLGELLPAERGKMSEETAAISVDQLLTNTAGLPNEWNGTYVFQDSPNWVRTIVRDRAEAKPADTDFAPSTAGPHLLAAILAEATGQSVLGFARKNLFGPLDIPSRPAYESVLVLGSGGPQHDPLLRVDQSLIPSFGSGFAWQTDPQGIHEGTVSLRLRPQDLLKIGLLFANHGRWGSQQVVSASWVDASSAAQVPDVGSSSYHSESFGYQWWVTDGESGPASFTIAYGGSILAVVPALELVVVVVLEYDPRDPEAERHALPGSRAIGLVESWIAPHVSL
jgi:CubicO group peptidase (beta-lactamase class C family)